jgi:hypothetical protein
MLAIARWQQTSLKIELESGATTGKRHESELDVLESEILVVERYYIAH